MIEISNEVIMLCGCMMASKPIGGAMSNEVEWGCVKRSDVGNLV